MDISLGVVAGLVELVSNGILCGSGAGAEAGIVVLGNLLVGLLGSLGTGALDRLGNVVGGVLEDVSMLHEGEGEVKASESEMESASGDREETERKLTLMVSILD